MSRPVPSPPPQTRDDAPGRLLRRLHRRALLATIGVAIGGIVSLVIAMVQLDHGMGHTSLLDRIGRQRMFGQRMGVLALAAERAGTAAERAYWQAVGRATADSARIERRLLIGSPIVPEQTRSLLRADQPAYDSLLALGTTLLAGAGAPATPARARQWREYVALEERVLGAAQSAMTRYVRLADARAQRTMQFVATGGVVALGVLGWLALGGIFPLLGRVRDDLAQLARQREALERDNRALEEDRAWMEREHVARLEQLERQFDRMLQASERQVQALLQGAGSVILGLRPDGTIFEWNQAAEHLFGRRRVAVIGTNYVERFVAEPLRDAVRADMARVLAGTPTRDFINDVVRPDGTSATLVWNVDRLVDDEGEPIGVVAMGTDISERVAADERFRVLFEASSDPHLLFDEGGVIDCNDAAVQFLRAGSKSALLGLHPAVLSPEWQPGGERSLDLAARMDAMARAQGLHRFDWVHRRLDGTEVTVEVSLTPVRLRGRPALLAVWHDLTERRAHEAALLAARDAAEEANRAKSTFLAAMSHELRTPLNSIIGFTRQVRRNKYGHLHATELSFLERVERNGVNLLALINDLLDLTKIEAGRMDLVLAATDLRGLAAETVAQLEGQPRKPGVALVAELPADPVRIHADELRLRQVIVNLVGNALKFTHAGTVTVRLVAPADAPVALEVVDTGIGIAEHRLEAIFREFEQAERTTARDYGGTGLGLAISRKLCRMMGAELTVASTVGVGTTFRVIFPSPAPAAAPASLAGAGA